jgi:hypothetical protein
MLQYNVLCSAPGCSQQAIYKIGATWSDGKQRELKNYGMACEEHRVQQLERAKAQRDRLRLAEGESVGRVELYQLVPGVRDADLPKVPGA